MSLFSDPHAALDETRNAHWRVFDIANSKRIASWIVAPDEESAIGLFLALGRAKSRTGIRSITDVTATWRVQRAKSLGLTALLPTLSAPSWLAIAVDWRPIVVATLLPSGEVTFPNTGVVRPAAGAVATSSNGR